MEDLNGPYDVVWYTPQSKAWALNNVRTLPPEEIARRGLNPALRGLRFCFDGCPMPGGGRGSVVMTNLIGTQSVAAGGDKWLDMLTVLHKTPDDCAGLWNVGAFSLDAVRDQENTERAGREASERLKRERFEAECVAIGATLSGYLDICRLMREKKPNLKLIRSMCRGDDLDAIKSFLARLDPEPADTRAIDPEAVARSAMVGLVNRSEFTRKGVSRFRRAV